MGETTKLANLIDPEAKNSISGSRLSRKSVFSSTYDCTIFFHDRSDDL